MTQRITAITGTDHGIAGLVFKLVRPSAAHVAPANVVMNSPSSPNQRTASGPKASGLVMVGACVRSHRRTDLSAEVFARDDGKMVTVSNWRVQFHESALNHSVVECRVR